MSELIPKRFVKTTVAAIITRKGKTDHQILLTKRGFPPYKGQWCLPGGHIDEFETANSAIIREVKEEIGLDFKARFFNYFDEIIPEKNIHAVVLAFDGTVSGDLQAQPGEVIEIKWFILSGYRKEHLAFRHNQIIDMYFKSK